MALFEQVDRTTGASEHQQNTTFLPTIQLGRGIAALLVLFYHVSVAVFASVPAFIFHGGAAGVDIFFVISGFIITYVSRNDDASRFLIKRGIRIVPLYYLYTTLVIAILVLKPALYANLRFKWSFVILSYLFVLSPSNTGAPGVAIGVGWTLAYEAYFYLLMAGGIGLAGRRGWMVASVAVLVGAALSAVAVPPAWLMPVVSLLPLEFLAGVVLAQLYLRGRRLGTSAAVIALVLGLVAIVAAGVADLVDGEFATPSRVLWYGVPAAAVVAGLLSLHGRLTVARPLLWIGDASYSLYLCHAFVIAAMIHVVTRLGLSWPIAIALLIGTSLLVAALSYRLFERPVTRFLARWFAVRNPQPAAREASAAAPNVR